MTRTNCKWTVEFLEPEAQVVACKFVTFYLQRNPKVNKYLSRKIPGLPEPPIFWNFRLRPSWGQIPAPAPTPRSPPPRPPTTPRPRCLRPRRPPTNRYSFSSSYFFLSSFSYSYWWVCVRWLTWLGAPGWGVSRCCGTWCPPGWPCSHHSRASPIAGSRPAAWSDPRKEPAPKRTLLEKNLAITLKQNFTRTNSSNLLSTGTQKNLNARRKTSDWYGKLPKNLKLVKASHKET